MRIEILEHNRKRIVIEPHDLGGEGVGVEIQVQGFKASPEEVDAGNTHVYFERWEGETRMILWPSGVQDAIIYNLEPSDPEETKDE